MSETSRNVLGSCLTLFITISAIVGLLVVIGALVLLFSSVAGA
jgi:hypothetical protein